MMKAYADFNEFFEDQQATHQAILRRLRRFVKKSAPNLVESVKWGNGCWLGAQGPVAYAHASPDHIQFGFFAGSRLKDPGQRLIGKGAHVRHVKLFKPADVDPKLLGPWLKQAAKL